MTGRYERRQILKYAANLADRTKAKTRAAFEILDWIDQNFEIAGFEVSRPDAAETSRPRIRRAQGRVDAVTWTAVRNAFRAEIGRINSVQPSIHARNLEQITDHFGLDEIERHLLEIACLYQIHPAFENLVDWMIINSALPVKDLFARMSGETSAVIACRLTDKSRLIRSGLLAFGDSGRHVTRMLPQANESLVDAIQYPTKHINELRHRIIGEPARTDLEWADFDHVAKERDFITDLVTGSLRCREHGINILIYGPSGTGKTEFCKAVAARVGADLFHVAEDDNGDEPSRSDRLARVRLAQRMLTDCQNVMVLFDEMEDLLGDHTANLSALFGGRPKTGSKVFAHRLLEGNDVPTFWTCNNIEGFDPATLRRMAFAAEMTIPPPQVRERIWRRILKRQRVRIREDEIRLLAHTFDAPPALAANAVKAAKLAGGGVSRIHMAVRSVAKVMAGGCEPAPRHPLNDTYDPRLAHADADLEALVERLTQLGPATAFSLCLFGPSGTGKTAYVRFLAARVGLEVVQKRASDLLSMWVGGSEKNIARAFAEALRSKSFLVIDEADSLLRDRTGAQRSWEVTQVNEMLTWMENHPLPFACTTNLMDSLDPASLRRFTFKIGFDWMNAAQVREAFAAFFGNEAPTGVENLDRLTPGDFALVRSKAAVLGVEKDLFVLTEMLRAECDAKPNIPRPIGFGRR